MDNENEFNVNEKTYVAVDSCSDCEECALDDEMNSCELMRERPMCSAMFRRDGRSVIFVEKHP